MISPQRSAGELPGDPRRLSLAYRTWQFVGSAGGGGASTRSPAPGASRSAADRRATVHVPRLTRPPPGRAPRC
ncbi:hypothetical protein B9W62_22100 [Streptomyces sp. CS113]|nr:hypothetical protein B9W62_22100 [Streptomyces sp. CS113]